MRDAGGTPGTEAVYTDGWDAPGEGADAVGGPEQARWWASCVWRKRDWERELPRTTASSGVRRRSKSGRRGASQSREGAACAMSARKEESRRTRSQMSRTRINTSGDESIARPYADSVDGGRRSERMLGRVDRSYVG